MEDNIKIANMIASEEAQVQIIEKMDTALDNIVSSIESLYNAFEEYEKQPNLPEAEKVALNRAKDILERGVIPYMSEVNDSLTPILEETE